MSDWRDDEEGGPSRGSRSSSELLDLVRTAEEEARIATRQAPPSSAAQIVEADELLPEDAPARNDDVVEVGDEAIDAPPSHPTAPPAANVSAQESVPARSALLAAPPPRRAMSPLAAIALLFALIGVALAVLAR